MTVNKKKVLWIEDGVDNEVCYLIGSVIRDMKYSLDTAKTVTVALKKLNANSYDIIIVDIRIPPGSDLDWINYYMRKGGNIITARLGINLLYSIFNLKFAESPKCKMHEKYKDPRMYGILTNETLNEVEEDLKLLGIRNNAFMHKPESKSRKKLLDLIRIVEKNIIEQ